MKKKKSDGYFDVEIDMDAFQTMGCLDDIFYLKDLKQRKLFLNCDIDQYTVHEIKKLILQYNTEDKGLSYTDRKPI